MGEIGVETDFDAIAADWDGLCDRLAAPPFLRPGWLTAWRSAFGAGQLQLVVARREGRLVGVLPLELRRGVVRGLANYHSPGFGAVVDDVAVARALWTGAAGPTRRRLSLAMLDRADVMLGVAKATARSAGWRELTKTMMRTPEVNVDGDWDSYLAGRDRRFRKELGRYRRRLEEAGEARIETSDGTDELERRLDELFAVEGTGWKAESGTAINSRPETRQFYEELARWAVERGMLRLFVLRLGGKPIAVDYALESNGIRYMLKGGFDPEYGKLAPGTILLEAGLKDAFESGLERVELGGDDDAYKLKWTADIHERHLMEAFPRTPLGLAEWFAFAVARPIVKRALRRDGRATREMRGPT